MRLFLLFVIFTLYGLEAKTLNIHLPQQTKSQLCKKLSDHECTKEEQLQYKSYFKLNNDRLMLFFNTYNKNALYPNGSLNVPVIVDINGRWQVIDNYIKDEIIAILHDPHDGIWLHTMSTRRDGYSSLYYSRDGINWQKIKLPSIRTFQTMQICFQDNDIIVTFQRVENDNVKAWITTYQDAISPEPKWRLMEKKELYQKVCQKISAYNNAWRLKSKKDSSNILFKHKYKNIAISFPKRTFYRPNSIRKAPIENYSKPIPPAITKIENSGKYTIQLGTFNYKTSLPLIYQEFSRLKKGIVTKEIDNGNRVQYKIFLERFRDRYEATIRLGEIRSEYPNSKIAKGAFITKIPQ